MQTRHSGVIGNANHIQIVALIRDKLLLGNASDGLNLIAQPGRVFEAQ